ncbi:hypothetical protein GCM10009753_11110 [Streptantibioticus ferralitis]
MTVGALADPCRSVTGRVFIPPNPPRRYRGHREDSSVRGTAFPCSGKTPPGDFYPAPITGSFTATGAGVHGKW